MTVDDGGAMTALTYCIVTLWPDLTSLSLGACRGCSGPPALLFKNGGMSGICGAFRCDVMAAAGERREMLCWASSYAGGSFLRSHLPCLCSFSFFLCW